jgi:RsiW-degrading membrane proteinase PrsW (M82 family)
MITPRHILWTWLTLAILVALAYDAALLDRQATAILEIALAGGTATIGRVMRRRV